MILMTMIMTVIMTGLHTQRSVSQNLQFGLYAEPLISWFGTDTDAAISSGARPGIAFGITLDRYFARNFAFTAGLSIANASGRLMYSEDIPLYLKYSRVDLAAGEKVTYKIRYLSIPAGLKVTTNVISYTAFSASFGFSPKVIIGGKGSIPTHDIEKESITDELKFFALGFFINLTAEYPLGESTALIGGLGYENVFTNVTTDHSGQPQDKITHNILQFRIGLIF